MTDVTREQVYGALFALISQGEGQPGRITWGSGQTLAYTSRRVRLWDSLPAQPALCQAEHDETYAQATRLPYKRVWTASWLIYHKAGSDPNAVPTQTSNPLLDAVEVALQPAPTDPGFPEPRNTLGGLVHHCFISGKIFKDPGDLDGQALIIVPITMLVP